MAIVQILPKNATLSWDSNGCKPAILSHFQKRYFPNTRLDHRTRSVSRKIPVLAEGSRLSIESLISENFYTQINQIYKTVDFDFILTSIK